MSHHWMRRLLVGALVTLFGLGGLSVTPASAGQPDVQVTVAYGQTTYKSNDTFTVTLTVTNNTDQEFLGLDAFMQNGNCVGETFGWSKLGNFVLPAHGTISDTETGPNPILGGLGGTLTCAGTVFGDGMNIPYSTTVTVIQVYGDYTGVLYRDRNHDGTVEAGEGVGGIKVQLGLSGSPNDLTFTTTSGPDGSFAFHHIPVGQYFANVSSRRNWVVDDPRFLGNGAEVMVTEAAQPPIVLRVLPPLSDRLKAAFSFDQTSYQPTDTVHVTVTLTNTSMKAITGVIADCNRIGDDNNLSSFEGWGDLSADGPGATIPAGTTVTFHIDLPMPAGAATSGFVGAPCVFGPEPPPDQLPQVGFPGGDPKVEVVGLISDTVLQFVRSDDTTVPVAGMKVRIVDEIVKHVVTVATTDANGEIHLPTLPAGLYTLHPLGGFMIPVGQSNELPARSPGRTDPPMSYEVTPPTR